MFNHESIMQSFKTFGSFKIKSRTLEFNIIFSFLRVSGLTLMTLSWLLQCSTRSNRKWTFSKL